jgi:hypothetical protein
MEFYVKVRDKNKKFIDGFICHFDNVETLEKALSDYYSNYECEYGEFTKS